MPSSRSLVKSVTESSPAHPLLTHIWIRRNSLLGLPSCDPSPSSTLTIHRMGYPSPCVRLSRALPISLLTTTGGQTTSLRPVGETQLGRESATGDGNAQSETEAKLSTTLTFRLPGQSCEEVSQPTHIFSNASSSPGLRLCFPYLPLRLLTLVIPSVVLFSPPPF